MFYRLFSLKSVGSARKEMALRVSLGTLGVAMAFFCEIRSYFPILQIGTGSGQDSSTLLSALGVQDFRSAFALTAVPELLPCL